MSNVKVAFICVHNSCRSQMAEALGKKYGIDVFESYSAGTDAGTGPLQGPAQLLGGYAQGHGAEKAVRRHSLGPGRRTYTPAADPSGE